MEKKSTEIPLVVASERGPGQCFLECNAKRMESLSIAGDRPLAVKL